MKTIVPDVYTKVNAVKMVELVKDMTLAEKWKHGVVVGCTCDADWLVAVAAARSIYRQRIDEHFPSDFFIATVSLSLQGVLQLTRTNESLCTTRQGSHEVRRVTQDDGQPHPAQTGRLES